MKKVLFTCVFLLIATSAGADVDKRTLAADPDKLDAISDIPFDATTAYGDPMVPDADMDQAITLREQNEQYRRGRMAFLFGQYNIALKFWEPLAVSGYAKAQATLGWIYHTGKGAKKDLNKARYWYRRASYQSHEIALNNLGVFYEQGLGVGKNYGKASEYYTAAANLGYGFAQYNLGMLYLTGRGVEKDKNKAIYWLEIASYQGVEQARDELLALGRKIDIPQHKAVNAKSETAPKWHKNQHGGDHAPHGYDELYNKSDTDATARSGNGANSSGKPGLSLEPVPPKPVSGNNKK